MPSHCILTVNGGSSSIRCAIYEVGAAASIKLLSRIKIDKIGHPDAQLSISSIDKPVANQSVDATRRGDAIAALLNALASLDDIARIKTIGHRIVHGMRHSQPQLIDASLLDELQQLHALDPEHLPFELELVAAFKQRFPAVPQVACFDTAFHRSIPDVARTLPLPKLYRDANIERYGFHGLSYSYLMQELAGIDSAASNGRIVLAHLGNGASLAAIRNGKCIDTSMSFTPASGIMMATRSGDIDPGILYYLSKSRNISIDELQRMLNHESGMLGISGVSGDVRQLLECEHSNPHAALALNMFCYQVRKYIGAYAAALSGVDTVIFSGGIGENAPIIRQRICNGLQFLGIHVEDDANQRNAQIISASGSITVRVMQTDEELMIARSVSSFA